MIKGIAASSRERGRHIVTSAVEHPAVIEPCQALEAEGFEVTYLPVDARGRVDPDDVARALTPGTILITVMHANNEVGTVQPIAEIAALARERGIPVHTDAAQSVGKIPVRVDDLGVDFLSVAGHKLYAPKGVGALYIRAGRELPKLMHGAGTRVEPPGGHRERPRDRGPGQGRRARRRPARGDGASHAGAARSAARRALEARLGPVRVNGDLEGGLPNTLSVVLSPASTPRRCWPRWATRWRPRPAPRATRTAWTSPPCSRR